MVVKNTTYSDQVFRMATSHFVKFFTNGWGSTEVLRQLGEWQHIVLDKRKMLKDVYNSLEKTEIKLSAGKRINSSAIVYKGEFVSPLTKIMPKALPPESEKAHFQLVLPVHWKNKKPVCIHLAGTGDHYFWRRRHFMALPLAKEYGIASIILENPFYGYRKPKSQIRSSVNHVSDIFVMGAALLFETVALMLWCRRNDYGPLGVTGVSMGGHMATIASAGWYDPIAIVPCLSWSSAAPAFTKGVLSHSVNWSVLEKQLEQNPEYHKVLRNDTEFKNLLDNHYTSKIISNEMTENSFPQKDNLTDIFPASETMESRNSTIYSKFTSALTGLQLSSYLDLKGKKIGPIALETDLWKYVETVPKQLYSSTFSRLNFDYLRELTFSGENDSRNPSEETVAYMTAIMDQNTHLAHYKKPNNDSPVVYVIAEHDRYIPRECYHVTPKDVWPNTEVRTINCGHVIACLNHQQNFRYAIKDAYQKLGCQFDDV